MKVLIALEGVSPGESGGVENFIYSLIRGLDRACPEVEMFLWVDPGTTKAFEQVLPGARVTYLDSRQFSRAAGRIGSGPLLRSARNRLRVSRVGRRLESYRVRRWHAYCESLVDVVLYPHRRLPIIHLHKPVVMTLHDLRWFERPETGSKLQALLRRGPVAALVTSWPDPFMRLRRMLPNMGEACFMVPFVADPPPPDTLIDGAVIPRTLLYTTNNGVEKNHEALIRALGVLKRRGVQPIQVFCTGPLFPERSKVLDLLIREEGVQEWIFFLGWVPREFVKWLYRSTAGAISTTTYEAMSGTVLEAWQYGKPVACSRIPSIQAVTDLLKVDVAFFDPSDPSDVAGAIESVLEEPERYRLGSLRARSALSRISQESTAMQYRDVLAWACGQAQRPSWSPFRPWWEDEPLDTESRGLT